ncbi:DUF922 domain-containing protein [Mesorhizobium sp. LHD-90]|uniref:DUF922 domain-containing protein n=1 Tax=Mesorhizobium sp. LHD-90 TaxID=3071414 RepID=UPI0027E17877|nr:DUF922 domain-containing protein [Mesorhizobium sp. LHD-90]MDQ6436921.1 DUF922 domain-containing protein [Mesorhizobium sp. LHD-90]
MRQIAYALLIAGCLMPTGAQAAVKSVVKVETYRVSGNNGAELMQSMESRGPRHGFLARAIAQTRYSVAWEMTWAVSDRRCKLKDADVTLSVNYRYPALAGRPSAGLRTRWKVFMTGVRRHEETHGRIARQMVNAAYKAVLRVKANDDPRCWKAKRQAMRVVQATYADYEARQERFDALEHQPGGPVERLVDRFIRRR